MADTNVGKVTQIVGAVIDAKFTEGKLPEIHDAITIATKSVTHCTPKYPST